MSTHIITSPGSYVTRDGRRAKVTEISAGHAWQFCCKGMVITPARRRDVWDFVSWRQDGRRLRSGDHPQDIVGPWPPTDNPSKQSG